MKPRALGGRATPGDHPPHVPITRILSVFSVTLSVVHESAHLCRLNRHAPQFFSLPTTLKKKWSLPHGNQ